MNSHRDNVKDALVKYVEKELTFCDPSDTALDLTDTVFAALGITEDEQGAESEDFIE